MTTIHLLKATSQANLFFANLIFSSVSGPRELAVAIFNCSNLKINNLQTCVRCYMLN